MPEAGTARLKPGREKSVINRHPWLFSGAIARVDAKDGGDVDVLAADGRWLARGYFNARSQIQIRLLNWDQDVPVDAQFWQRRVEQAIEGRRLLPDWNSGAARLISAEADGLPGLVADMYVDADQREAVLVVQALTLGIEARREWLYDLLAKLVTPEALPQLGPWDRLTVFERSDADVRRLEGLETRVGLVSGSELGPLSVLEDGLAFEVDVKAGHKTGLYLDQGRNRVRLARYCREAEVLNAFAYTGGFGVHALRAGAQSVTDVDTSAAALAAGGRNLATNGLAAERREAVEGDVFQVLRRYRQEGRRFDVVVLDPPKFASNTKQVQAACRGYKDINMLGLALLRPGGILATFSCSGLVSADLFQKVVFGASVDAGREAQILEPLSQSPDHPVLLTFPESQYLKGLLCRVW